MTGLAHEPSVDLILEVVGATTGMTVARIRSGRRENDLSVARFMAYWLARRLTRLSLTEIGMEIGGRDPTTVGSGLRRIEELIHRSPKMVERLDNAVITIRVIAAKGLDLPTRPDGSQVAARILNHAQTMRAATSVSTRDIVSMAIRIVQLSRACELAAEFVAAEEAALDWTSRQISPADLPAMDEADEAASSARTTLAETLAALGYLTLENEEMTDGNAS